MAGKRRSWWPTKVPIGGHMARNWTIAVFNHVDIVIVDGSTITTLASASAWSSIFIFFFCLTTVQLFGLVVLVISRDSRTARPGSNNRKRLSELAPGAMSRMRALHKTRHSGAGQPGFDFALPTMRLARGIRKR